jgi:hypothetical protein
MRILLSFASEYDKGEGCHYATVLRRLGHDVVELNVAASAGRDGELRRVVPGYPPDATLDELAELCGGGDLFLYVEPLGLLPRGLEQTRLTTACVISDVHRGLRSRVELARFFDQVFLYQRDYARHFDRQPAGTVHWMPWACDTETFRDLGCERDLDVAFVGQLFGPNSERRRILTSLAKRYVVNEAGYYENREIPAMYSRAKIVLNLPLADDLNRRFFEALSCGAMLLTRRLESGQEALFTEGVHYVGFSTEEELFQKVERYLKNDAERCRIAAAGLAEVTARHSLDRRLRDGLLPFIGAPNPGHAPVRTWSRRHVLSAYGKYYQRQGDVNALLRLQADPEVTGLLRFELPARAFHAWARRTIRKS